MIVAACFKESDEEDEAVETHSQELLVEDIFLKNQCSVSRSSVIIVRHARPHKRHAVQFWF